jgi:gliding motility-associated-like protein
MKKIFLLLLSLMLFFGENTFASNILGGAITYKFISSSGSTSTYRITLELYSTCYVPGMVEYVYGDLHGLTPEILIKKDGIIIDRPKLAYIDSLSGQDITPLCPQLKHTSSCITPGGDYLGVEKYVYSSEAVLEGTDANWTFAFWGYLDPYYWAMICKFIGNADVTNMGLPITTDLVYLEATLNNTTGPNNSTIYTSPPIPFFCQDSKSYYGLGALDPDYDQLKFKMIPARSIVNVNGLYLNPTTKPTRYFDPPYSGERPLPTEPDSFYLNPNTGQITFTPNGTNICLVAVETDEYRNGQIVGTTMREMVFFIFDDCTSEAADPVVTNVKNADYATDEEGNVFFSACEGLTDTASFDINVTDPNSDSITVSSDNIPPAAIVTVDNNGTPHPLVHVKWSPIDALAVNYSFYLTFSGSGCPYNTRRNIGYSFVIVPHSIQFTRSASGSCVAAPDGKAWVIPIGEASIDYTYKWVDTATGNILRNVHSLTGDTLSNVPPGIYKVYVRNSDGCGKNFFIQVDTTLLPHVRLANDSTVCEGMPIALGVPSNNLETYQWNTGATTPAITATETGNYILTATNHCGAASDSVYLDFVKCKYCLFVPSAFSPNGDGNNDEFRIVPTCLFYKYKLQVFNRWGQLVYVSYSLNDRWNGTYNGHEAAIGTYYYSIEAILDDANKTPLQQKGTVTLIR